MRAVDIIRSKRDGGRLEQAAIDEFVAGVTDGSLPDYQASALLMAIVLRGMDEIETAWLTEAMVASGQRLDLSGISRPKVDKHSTGGVGDKTSLVLGPIAAACGLAVPMMSGRGLGHTGGTLDKIEAIAGFRVGLSPAELRAGLAEVGWLLVSQTADIAPADRVLYALRDVTATVESIPLITASIMSKKIAEGIEGLVLDVKTGRGAFMQTLDDSRRLAHALVAVGRRAGVRTRAVITAMDAPLGRAVGNALEVAERLATLKGRGPDDLEALSVRLAAEMVRVAGLAGTLEEAERRARGALDSGAALEAFRATVAHQGGDPRVVDDESLLPSAPGRHAVVAPRAGFVATLDAGRIGRAAAVLGAGRSRVDEPIDHAVGVLLRARVGDRVERGEALMDLCFRDDGRLAAALTLAREAVEIADEAPAPGPLVVEDLTGDGDERD